MYLSNMSAKSTDIVIVVFCLGMFTKPLLLKEVQESKQLTGSLRHTNGSHPCAPGLVERQNTRAVGVFTHHFPQVTLDSLRNPMTCMKLIPGIKKTKQQNTLRHILNNIISKKLTTSSAGSFGPLHIHLNISKHKQTL